MDHLSLDTPWYGWYPDPDSLGHQVMFCTQLSLKKSLVPKITELAIST
jgi:hypothetical protein